VWPRRGSWACLSSTQMLAGQTLPPTAHHLPPTTYLLPLTTQYLLTTHRSDAHRPDVLQVFLKDSRITAVVIALDNERMTTGSVRALKL